MIVVFRKSDRPRERAPGGRGHVAAVVAMVALFALIGAALRAIWNGFLGLIGWD
jgi:hypothetical protein